MSNHDHLMAMMLMTARGEKAQMRRMSRRASVRRCNRAVSREQAKRLQAERPEANWS